MNTASGYEPLVCKHVIMHRILFFLFLDFQIVPQQTYSSVMKSDFMCPGSLQVVTQTLSHTASSTGVKLLARSCLAVFVFRILRPHGACLELLVENQDTLEVPSLHWPVTQ